MSGPAATALRRLDERLEPAITAARRAYRHGGGDPFRGLVITDEEIERLLAAAPGEPAFAMPAPDERAAGRLSTLAGRFGLDAFDLDVLALALAPEIDLRYQRLYAYLQDDVTRRRPSADLALTLFCPAPEARLAYRARFLPTGPLVRHGLLHLGDDQADAGMPLLARPVTLAPPVLSYLLGEPPAVEPYGRFEAPAPAELPAGLDPDRLPARLHFLGRAGSGRRHAAAALAGRLGAPLLTVDAAALPESGAETAALVLTAGLHGAVVYLDLGGVAPERRRSLTAATRWHPGVVVLAGTEPWPSSPAGDDPPVTVAFPPPSIGARHGWWRAALAAAGVAAPPETVDALAARFRFGPDDVAAVVAATRCRPGDPAALFAAARARRGHDLARLATRREPVHGWDDLVLPEEQLTHLRELCGRAAQGRRVLDEWGFGRTLPGAGVRALFAGPSGTGKTMAAQVLARELGLDLYQIDLAGVVSKYIGETEKNLDRVFTAAEDADVILFFDEADALFGRRSAVRDSHDRYANIEVSYLLQRMEAYAGPAILASNLRAHLDEAFLRRLTDVVHFPMPQEAERRRIWRTVWPAATPLAGDVDGELLAREVALPGGNLRNIAVAAAFLAAADGGPVALAHVRRAVAREYAKLGRALPDDVLSRWPA